MLGVYTSPNYASDHNVYLTYSEPADSGGGSSLALGLSKLVPIAIVVAILLVIVATSYRQTIFAYPSGGGSYIVSRENLGEMPSLVAGASLLVDYILTVAVSVSAGVAAIISIPQFQSLAHHRVALALVIVAFITVANLRGVKESGRIFAFRDVSAEQAHRCDKCNGASGTTFEPGREWWTLAPLLER